MRQKAFLGLSLLLLAIPLTTSATQYISECGNIQYVFNSADIIVSGHVIGVDTKKEASGNIFTYVTFRVDTYVKGEGSRYVTIKMFGGKIGNEEQTAADTPTFKFGQQGFLYLSKPTTAFYEGKYYGLVCGTGIMDEVPQSSQVGHKPPAETSPMTVNIKDSYFLISAAILILIGVGVIFSFLYAKNPLK